MGKKSKRKRMAFLNRDLENHMIRQKLNNLNLCELRQMFFELLKTSKSTYLIEKLDEVYNSRSRQTHPSEYKPDSETFKSQSVNLVQRSLINPCSNNLLDPSQGLQNRTTEFEQLPFFKILDTLLIPMHCNTDTNLVNFTISFSLDDDFKRLLDKSWNISKQEHKIQIILRLVQFGLEENVKERLPNNLVVHVNNNKINLTEVYDTKWRCNVPINITQEIALNSSNKLQASWSSNLHQYKAGLFVAQKLTYEDLLAQLKERPLRPSNITKEFIKMSFKSDDDIMVMDFIFTTLNDPLSKIRMQLPVRGMDCLHIQCFDAIQFLQMNELKQTWICPICRKNAKFNNIEVDEFFLNILSSPNLSEECEKVILFADGRWAERMAEKRNENISKRKDHPPTRKIPVFTLSDSDDTYDTDDTENKKLPKKRSKI